MKTTRLLAAAILLCSLQLSAMPGHAADLELPSYDRVRVLPSPRNITDAELLDQDGRPFKLSELQGQVALILFGFTHCPDVCPAALSSLRQLEMSGGSELADVAYVMISVDGDRHEFPRLSQDLPGRRRVAGQKQRQVELRGCHRLIDVLHEDAWFRHPQGCRNTLI